MAGSFVLGDETFVCAAGRVVLVHEYEGERPYLDLEIATESAGDEETPRLVIDHLRFDVADWKALEGTSHSIPDPDEEDEQDQNIFRGPDFENVLQLVIELGAIGDAVIAVTVRGVAMHPTENENVEEAIPFTIRAECTIEPAPPPINVAFPPSGPKTCRVCGAVSADLVERCPACDAPGWFSPR